jgi:hypothetical protein
MTKDPQKKKSAARQSRQTAETPHRSTQKEARISKENGRLIGITMLGVVLSLVFAVPPLSPIFTTLPVVRPLLRRVRAGERAAATGAFWRWALTVFLTTLVSGAFVRQRMLSSFPFADQAARAMEQVLAGSGGAAPAGLAEIIVGLAAFLLLSAASLGIAGCVLMSVALGAAAGAAVVLFTHGNNVLLIALVACPPWLWALLAAAVLSFVPALTFGGSRWFGIVASMMDRDWLRRRAIMSGGLFLLAILLRIVLTGPYLALVRLWTVT